MKLVPVHLVTVKKIHNYAIILTQYGIPTTRNSSDMNVTTIRDIVKLIALVIFGRVALILIATKLTIVND